MKKQPVLQVKIDGGFAEVTIGSAGMVDVTLLQGKRTTPLGTRAADDPVLPNEVRRALLGLLETAWAFSSLIRLTPAQLAGKSATEQAQYIRRRLRRAGIDPNNYPGILTRLVAADRRDAGKKTGVVIRTLDTGRRKPLALAGGSLIRIASNTATPCRQAVSRPPL